VTTSIGATRNHKAYVGSISNNLVLDLLPSLETLLNQDLGRQAERLGREISKLVLVVGETRTETTEGEGRSKDDRVTDGGSSLEGIVDGSDGGRLSGGNVDLCKAKAKRICSSQQREG
jgi:hypothetical protein